MTPNADGKRAHLLGLLVEINKQEWTGISKGSLSRMMMVMVFEICCWYWIECHGNWRDGWNGRGS
jgi:hypothetical protein